MAEHIADPPARRRVVCYPVQLATPAPLTTATVERKEQGEVTVLTYRGESQRVNTPYFHKLVSDAGYFGFKERKEREEEYLYSAIYTRSTHTPQSTQAWITCKLHHACLSFISIHQMAPPLTEVANIQLQLTNLSTSKG